MRRLFWCLTNVNDEFVEGSLLQSVPVNIYASSVYSSQHVRFFSLFQSNRQHIRFFSLFQSNQPILKSIPVKSSTYTLLQSIPVNIYASSVYSSQTNLFSSLGMPSGQFTVLAVVSNVLTGIDWARLDISARAFVPRVRHHHFKITPSSFTTKNRTISSTSYIFS